ncbi:MAG: hypothetical protein DMG64_08730 [Acidobacteria bacterium]|nr:MAG: hypothetical protein DMG64_08730 [Acidobacteriota bacterium]
MLRNTRRWKMSMMETLFEPEFATKARVPSAETSTKYGVRSRAMIPTTLFSSASITLSELDPVLTT